MFTFMFTCLWWWSCVPFYSYGFPYSSPSYALLFVVVVFVFFLLLPPW